MAHTAWNKADDGEFRRLYHAGNSPRQIADAMGLSPKSITGIRRRLDLPPFARNSYKINHETFLELCEKGLTVREIAAELHVNESSARRMRHRLGLPPIPRPERRQRDGRKRRIIDREAIRMLTAEGLSAREIAETIGCAKGTVERIRRELGLTKRQVGAYPPEVHAKAREMLEGGASYHETARTLHVPADRIRKWFPGMGWTAQQTAEYRWMLKKLEKLDTRADRRVYSNL